MSFLDTVRRAKTYLGEQGRVSLSALKLEFDLEDARLESLIEELVDVQQVAALEGKVLSWIGRTPSEASTAQPAPTATERTPRDYTPKHLADKILQSKSALEGERKQVTVLFADVKGSMEISEQIDPEEWHGIMDRFFQILTEGVHRFEGTVNQYTGDGIMALFGAPIAHEDHARRGCYTALRLRDEVREYADELRVERGLNFGVRIGLNSGEVVVGKIGDDLRMDYTAQGHTVGLAQRMEQLAESGRICLSEHTAHLAEGYFALRDLGASRIKGVGEPLHVYELEGVGPMQTRLDVSRSRGFSRFVGRADELATLEATLERAVAGDGQVVGVVAEAGVGKSRLCFELAERCRARGIPVVEAHAVAHGKRVPFLPLLELLRSTFQIAQGDSEEAARRKIAGTLLLLDREFDEALPLLFEFLDVGDPERRPPRMDPEARQRALFGIVRRIVQAQSAREPGVILIEDLHWIDGGSEAFLESLVGTLTGIPTLLLLNFRPEYHAAWMQKSYYQQLPLLPLAAEAIRELLLDLLGSDASLEGLADLIHERTAGNPFFIEEVVQSLSEGGSLEGSRGTYRLVAPVEELAVPATVQAALAARIDRLAEREKQVLQTASVIGKKFGEAVLERIADLPAIDLGEALHRLIGAEFLYEDALYPRVEYAFKHPLTQEVAYHSQLGERRARVHEAVARAIEELGSEQRGENAALIAHHWESAGDALEAARWHRRAGVWAAVRAPAESMRHWRTVRDLLARVPESPLTIRWNAIACLQLLNLGWRQGGVVEEADALFLEGKALAERTGDLGILALLHGTYATVLGLSGHVEDWIRYATEGSRLAEQSGSEGLQVAASVILGTAISKIDVPRAIGIGERGLALTRDDPTVAADLLDFSPYLFLTATRGGWLAQVGRLAEGAESLQRALRLAREHDDLIVQAFATGWHVYLASLSGDFSGALAHGRAGVELAERMGSATILVEAYGQLGSAFVLEENWAEAAKALEHSLALMREARMLGAEAEALAGLARVHAALGEGSVARATAEKGVAAAQRCKLIISEIEAQLSLAHVLLADGNLDDRAAIESALGRAAECVGITGARIYLPRIGVERAKLARLEGDEAGRERHLREAHRLYTEMGATGHAERVARELGL
jgi:class 3 adenylate cyclase/broad specificity phosphatase PhoE